MAEPFSLKAQSVEVKNSSSLSIDHSAFLPISKYISEHQAVDPEISYQLLGGFDDLNVHQIIDTPDGKYYICSQNESTLEAPHCFCSKKAQRMTGVKSYKIRALYDLPFNNQSRTILTKVKNCQCPSCRRSQLMPLKCADNGANYTTRLIEAVYQEVLGENETFADVQRRFIIPAANLENWVWDRIKWLRANGVVYEAAKHMGIDETKLKTKGYDNRMTLSVMRTDWDDPDDPDVTSITPQTELLSLDLMEHLTAKEVQKKLERFSGRDTVETVTMDMSATMLAAARAAFPNATPIADRFHVVKNLTDRTKQAATAIYYDAKKKREKILKIKAVDTTSIEEAAIDVDDGEGMSLSEEEREARADIIAKKLPGDEGLTPEQIKAKAEYNLLIHNYSNKWFGMDPERWTRLTQGKFNLLGRLVPEFKLLVDVKEHMRVDFYDQPDVVSAKAYAQSMEALLPHKNGKITGNFKALEPFFDHFRPDNLWYDIIFNYFKYPEVGYTNAALESFHSRLKTLNRESKGASFDLIWGKVMFGKTGHKYQPVSNSQPQVQSASAAMAKVSGIYRYFDGTLKVNFSEIVKVERFREAIAAATLLSEEEKAAAQSDGIQILVRHFTRAQGIDATPEGVRNSVICWLHEQDVLTDAAYMQYEDVEYVLPLNLNEFNRDFDAKMAVLRQDIEWLAQSEAEMEDVTEMFIDSDFRELHCVGSLAVDSMDYKFDSLGIPCDGPLDPQTMADGFLVYYKALSYNPNVIGSDTIKNIELYTVGREFVEQPLEPVQLMSGEWVYRFRLPGTSSDELEAEYYIRGNRIYKGCRTY